MPIVTGPGGIPSLTAEHVAGAVGMMFEGKRHFAADVLLQLHWRAAASSRADFDRMLIGMISKECQARRQAWAEAKASHDEAIANYEDAQHHTERQYSSLNALANRARDLKARTFPDQPAMWPRIRDAVLAELSNPNHCQDCDGRGIVLGKSGIQDCLQCEGRGLVPVSDSQRARWLKRDESTYRDAWRGMYEWLYGVVSAAELAGVRELRNRLFGSNDRFDQAKQCA